VTLLDYFRKAKPDRPPSDEPISPIVVMSGQPVRFLSGAAIMTAEVAQRKSSQLYRITNFIAATVQAVPWYAEPDPDVPASNRAAAGPVKALNDLLKSPNDTTTAENLRYWVALNLMLYARAHFKVGVGSAGQPNGIYPLAAKHIKGVPNGRGSVDKYEYGSGENIITLPTRRTAEKTAKGTAYAAEVSFPSLSGLVEYNKAPAAIESIAHPIAIISALMQRALDTSSGHPNVKYVITAERALTRQQRDLLYKHLEQSGPGEEGSGNVLLLFNTEIKVHQLDSKLDDIHSKLPLDDMTRQIAGVFGVPIALLGLGSADAAKYAANYNESRLSFFQDTIIPCYLAPISAGLTQALCPPGARIVFDYDSVPALWDGRAALGERLSRVTFLTTNEKRAILGFPPTTEIPAIITAPSQTPLRDTADPLKASDSNASVESKVFDMRKVS
jgi:hypothetical protein